MILGISGRINSGKDTVGSIIQYLLIEKLWKESCPGEEIYTIKEYLDNKNGCQALSNWKIVKFADKLKDCVCIILGCTRKQLEDREFKDKELGEEWTVYQYADTFWRDSKGNPVMQMIMCSKEKYLEEYKINWQTANKYTLTPRLILQLLGTECGRQIIHPNTWVNATMADYKGERDLGEKIGIPRELPLIYPNWIITDVRFPNEVEAVRKARGIVIKIIRHNHPNEANPETEHESEKALDGYVDWDYVIINKGTIEDLVEEVRTILKLENLI